MTPHPSWLTLPVLGEIATSLMVVGSLVGLAAVRADAVEYLSDCPERLAQTRQDWGTLGFDVAAHAPDQAGLPLQIAEQRFDKGLGHHANGAITVLLDGACDRFEAQVGLQPCAGGSVVFRVLVDGLPRFESAVLKSGEAPQPVSVPLAGAQELILEAQDAGDGITCDMANWAEARLLRGERLPMRREEPGVDIAPFGRVLTWDPNRMHGTRANRLEEFPAEDLFLETDLVPEEQGRFRVPINTNHLACIGLQWLNRRAIKELGLEFVDSATMPTTNQVRVEGWFGESIWQGEWKPLAGEFAVDGNRISFHAAAKAPTGGLLLTRKVRWICPTGTEPIRVKRPSAYTRSRWATARLLVQWERPPEAEWGVKVLRASQGSAIVVRNGTLLEPREIRWDNRRPQTFTVRYSLPSALNSDPTLLRVRFEGYLGTVAVSDVLTNEAVYLPHLGALLCRADAPVKLADYKKRIAGRKTILEEVRALPDQTLEQAMLKTHRDAQREGPVMLSLAGDNHKFVVERDGTVRFQPGDVTNADWFATAGELRPRFGDGKPHNLRRTLDGGWLPIPVLEVATGGLRWHQRSFVAPTDAADADPARLNRPSVCVVEFNVTNTLDTAAETALTLDFLLNGRSKIPGQYTRGEGGYSLANGTPVIGRALTDAASPLVAEAKEGVLRLRGSLPAHGKAAFAVLLLTPGINALGLPAAARLRADTEAYWNVRLASATQIETPEPFLNNLIRSSQVRCLIAARNEAQGERIAPWIAAMSYGPLESEAHSVIRGMDFLGHAEFAQRALDYFIQRYNTNGFLTTGYTTFGTAWHLWTLGEHFQLTHDRAWLEPNRAEIKRVGHWIIRQSEKTKQPEPSPEPDPSPRPSPQPDSAAEKHRVGERVAEPGEGDGFMFTGQFKKEQVASPEPADSEGRAPRGPRREPKLSPARASRSSVLRGAGAAGHGLMPPGVMADWNSFAYHFCLNAYYAAGLRAVADALDGLGDPESALPRRHAGRLAAHTANHWSLTAADSPAVPLRDGTWVPYYPSQLHSPGKLGDFFPGDDAGRSWCYDVELGAHQLVPTGVLRAEDRRVTWMLDHLEDVQFLESGWFDYPAELNQRDWFNLGGFSKVQPYYTRNCEIYALRDDVKPFIRSYFNTLAAMVNPEVLTIWEHFNHSGAWDKTHETGYFLHQTRTMLVTERGDDLWLAPLITSNWLKHGQVVRVANAPTRFGPVSFRLESHVADRHIDATIEPPTRQPPASIVLRVRHPEGVLIRSVLVNGRKHRDFSRALETVKLTTRANPLHVQVRY